MSISKQFKLILDLIGLFDCVFSLEWYIKNLSLFCTENSKWHNIRNKTRSIYVSLNFPLTSFNVIHYLFSGQQNYYSLSNELSCLDPRIICLQFTYLLAFDIRLVTWVYPK